MPTQSGQSAQFNTDAMHNLAVLHARFEAKYSLKLLLLYLRIN